jgi:cystathionine beta-synthase
MPGVLEDIVQTIGDTPLVRLNRIAGGLAADVLAKVEFFNPGGSVKDRIGATMIDAAEADGSLRPGGTIVESTSGNTGVGLAISAALRGYDTIFVMPDKMSDEKIRLLRAFGSRVVITPTAVEPDDPRSYYSVAKRLVEETPGAILANQYHNPANPRAHYETTGPELWQQTGGRITHFVAGLGTGGTISGVGKFLKEQNPDIQIVGVDPVGSVLLDFFYTGIMPQAQSYKVEGIGEDFLPSTTDFGVVDDIVRITDGESFRMTRRLVREEGMFVGGSCGSALAGALKYVRDKQLGEDAVVVVLLPDSGSRYLSKVFNDDWLRENGFEMTERIHGTVADVLGTRGGREIVHASPQATVAEVVELMKIHGISQVPVVDDAGEIAGVVAERDLLQHLVADVAEGASPDEPIAGLVSNRMAIVDPGTSLTVLGRIFNDTELVIVHADNALRAVLTKIDLIDYVTDNYVNARRAEAEAVASSLRP